MPKILHEIYAPKSKSKKVCSIISEKTVACSVPVPDLQTPSEADVQPRGWSHWEAGFAAAYGTAGPTARARIHRARARHLSRCVRGGRIAKRPCALLKEMIANRARSVGGLGSVLTLSNALLGHHRRPFRKASDFGAISRSTPRSNRDLTISVQRTTWKVRLQRVSGKKCTRTWPIHASL